MPLRRGSAVALATPFDRHTGAIDLPAFRQLLQYHVTAGTDNLCLLGTTAEASVMTMAERAQILTTAVELVKGQIPIMVGCGTIDPSGVKDMIQQSIDLGADAALVVTPYYVKPPQRCLIQHFTNAAYMGLPIVIYNVPSRTGVDMSDESIAICALHDTIVGVKDATGKLERVQNLRDQLASTAATLQRSSTDSPFLLYSGDDATSMEFVLRGGDGCISVTANVAASSLHQIMSAALKGDADRANALNNPLLPLHDNLFCEANPIPVKYAMARVGLIPSAYCRPPLDFLDPSYESIVDSALRHAGLSIPNE